MRAGLHLIQKILTCLQGTGMRSGGILAEALLQALVFWTKYRAFMLISATYSKRNEVTRMFWHWPRRSGTWMESTPSTIMYLRKRHTRYVYLCRGTDRHCNLICQNTTASAFHQTPAFFLSRRIFPNMFRLRFVRPSEWDDNSIEHHASSSACFKRGCFEQTCRLVHSLT